MGWTPEERARREAARLEREARIQQERAERQAALQEYDRGFKEGLKTKPLDLEAAADDFVMKDGNFGDNAKGIFGWANNNPSSKNAVYDTEFIQSAAGGGNVGEMMIAMRGKGKTEESREVQIEGAGGRPLTIYYRQMGTITEGGPAPVLMCHGVLDHSWSWRELMGLLAAEGIPSIALDMPGCGYSSWPQPGFDFQWDPASVKGVYSKFLDAIGVGEVSLMTQGFIYSQYALQWGLENPDRVRRVVGLNMPLLPETALPFPLQQYQLPIVSSFVAQDAMRAERFLEGGSAYAMDVADADRFREPFLESMMPGLGVVDLMKNTDFPALLQRNYELLYGSEVPAMVAWGRQDKYLSDADAESFCQATGTEFVPLAGEAGFLAQMDYAESVKNAVRGFLLR